MLGSAQLLRRNGGLNRKLTVSASAYDSGAIFMPGFEAMIHRVYTSRCRINENFSDFDCQSCEETNPYGSPSWHNDLAIGPFGGPSSTPAKNKTKPLQVHVSAVTHSDGILFH